ncbi:MAG: amidohydrolase family protein [Gemmatimonadales bacterium]
MSFKSVSCVVVLAALVVVGCASERSGSVKVFTGARLIDGLGGPPVDDATIVVRDGRIEAVGPTGSVAEPRSSDVVDLSGRTVVPGFINTHGHVGATSQADSGPGLRSDLLNELQVYARYGITTVNSLGGEGPEAIALRDEQSFPALDRARLYVAGTVVTGDTPEAALQVVDENVRLHVDFIKIRVDDNLGTARKMTPDVYEPVIDRAHERGLAVASHIFYLEDAKELLRAGTDLVAHSVRDRPVDEEFIDLLEEHDVCYVPTLTREVSTFVYQSTPEYFDDPFFLKEADSSVIRSLSDPARQKRIRDSESARRYEKALEVALVNLKRVADGGATIAFGTDTGPFGRFQGYFEHMEMKLMADAGLSPMQIIVSATGDAARCLGLSELGTIEAGKRADFSVLSQDPLSDITNSRSIESVWIAGNRVPGRD